MLSGRYRLTYQVPEGKGDTRKERELFCHALEEEECRWPRMSGRDLVGIATQVEGRWRGGDNKLVREVSAGRYLCPAILTRRQMVE